MAPKSSARAARTVNTGVLVRLFILSTRNATCITSYQGRILGTVTSCFPSRHCRACRCIRSPLLILPFLAVLSVEPENMSTYVIVEEPGDWPQAMPTIC